VGAVGLVYKYFTKGIKSWPFYRGDFSRQVAAKTGSTLLLALALGS